MILDFGEYLINCMFVFLSWYVVSQSIRLWFVTAVSTSSLLLMLHQSWERFPWQLNIQWFYDMEAKLVGRDLNILFHERRHKYNLIITQSIDTPGPLNSLLVSRRQQKLGQDLHTKHTMLLWWRSLGANLQVSEIFLHCTMFDTSRAALLSLQVKWPQARSCLICRAKRYLWTENIGFSVQTMKMKSQQKNDGHSLTASWETELKHLHAPLRSP